MSVGMCSVPGSSAVETTTPWATVQPGPLALQVPKPATVPGRPAPSNGSVRAARGGRRSAAPGVAGPAAAVVDTGLADQRRPRQQQHDDRRPRSRRGPRSTAATAGARAARRRAVRHPLAAGWSPSSQLDQTRSVTYPCARRSERSSAVGCWRPPRLGAVIRIAWLVNQWNDPIGFEDAFFYHHQANLLADGHGFISPFPFLSSGIESPAAEHPPLFSLYLSVFSFLGATSVGWHQLATTLLGIATVPLIGFAGREAGGDRVGVIAAVIAAIYPHLWYQDGIVWAEASAQACVALFVLVAYRYVRRPSVRTLGALGLAGALAAMARTELVLLIPLGVIPLALLTQGLPRSRRISWAATGVAVGVAALLPWTAFNLARFEEPTTLSSNLGLTLASANCDSTWYGPTIGYWDFACAQTAGARASITKRRPVGGRRPGPGRGARLHQRATRAGCPRCWPPAWLGSPASGARASRSRSTSSSTAPSGWPSRASRSGGWWRRSPPWAWPPCAGPRSRRGRRWRPWSSC